MTGATKDRLSESSSINKSLTTLGMVVEALSKSTSSTAASSSSAPVRVPYRDSKLTRILQPALGGSALAMLVLNLRGEEGMVGDAVGSLGFASRTRKVECRVVENVVVKPRASIGELLFLISRYKRC